MGMRQVILGMPLEKGMLRDRFSRNSAAGVNRGRMAGTMGFASALTRHPALFCAGSVGGM